MTAEEFNCKFLSSSSGYSYHVLMKLGKDLLGAYNTIPCQYTFYGKPVVFCLSVDLMIDADYRKTDVFALSKMARLAEAAMKNDGVSFVFGFVNDSSRDYTQKVLRWRDMGLLDNYFLPRNIGAILPGFKCCNVFSRFIANMLVKLPGLPGGLNTHYHVKQNRDYQSMQHMYGSGCHSLELENGANCAFKIAKNRTGAKIVYVLDVHPLTSPNFCRAIRRIHDLTKRDIDLVLYTGNLPFMPSNMIKLPERLKRHGAMCGKILDHHTVDNRVYSIQNWSVNLSNSDI